MLILTRRVHESIMIGKNVEVVFLGFHGNQIRLGIEAPTDVPVHRKEVFDRIEAEEAAKVPNT